MRLLGVAPGDLLIVSKGNAFFGENKVLLNQSSYLELAVWVDLVAGDDGSEFVGVGPEKKNVKIALFLSGEKIRQKMNSL